MALKVRPLRGYACGGMKFHRMRSSVMNGKVAAARCSGLRLARKAVAADVTDHAERSAPTIDPTTTATRHATASIILFIAASYASNTILQHVTAPSALASSLTSTRSEEHT